ncbi:hypothetical protein G5I_14534 [Acromyrmex echinatior]|uniref:Uncharacterized protein n=1 Tax=Acromyrmex echinatior TaxID=103372 RepID=F4X7X9_ACREC|nr:hypothetical protein G5I_14534 [Acromyrmex echinatior]
MCAFCDKSRELDATGPANGRLSIPDLRTLRTLRGLRQKGQDAEVWRSSDEESEESEKADMVMREDRTENEDKRCCPDDLGRCGAAGTWELQPDQSTHPGPLSA